MLSRLAQPGRDIPPDEDRLNHWNFNGVGLTVSHQNSDNLILEDTETDLQEDGQSLVHTPTEHRTHMSLTFEPIDYSEGLNHDRRIQSRHHQHHNGSGYYNDERKRLETFVDWRYQNIVRKEDLAKNGFIYTGTADKVRCVFCNVMLRQWAAFDVVEEEHHTLSPTCPFLMGRNVGNIPLSSLPNGYRGTSSLEQHGHDVNPPEDRCESSSQSQIEGTNPSRVLSGLTVEDARMANGVYTATSQVNTMALESKRLATFQNWPPQMKQKPEQLAQAGLYYTGDGDKVKCFSCAGQLYNWDPEDDVFMEHARFFPSCQYMRLVKGEEFIQNAKNGSVTSQSFVQEPAVMAVLDQGFSVQQVQTAVDSLKAEHGNTIRLSAKHILARLYKIEDAAHGSTAVQSQPKVEEVEKLQKENESLKDKQLCKVCMENEVEVIFYPCKHLVCCASCSTGLRTCPICRKQISSIDKVFMA